MKRFATAALLSPLAGLFLAGAAYSQDMTADHLMMGDQTVPTEQVPAVKDWCRELQAQQGLTGTQEPESTMTEEQAESATATTDVNKDASATATPSADDKASTTGSSTTTSGSTSTTTGATTTTTGNAAGMDDDMSATSSSTKSDDDSDDDADSSAAPAAGEFDITAITLEMCQQAGLTGQALD